MRGGVQALQTQGPALLGLGLEGRWEERVDMRATRRAGVVALHGVLVDSSIAQRAMAWR